MALQSQLFQGDGQLEAAATIDRGHILPGASGPQVKKIQLALSLLDDAKISPHEALFGLYGATTARSVLEYKRKRKIINYSYQSTADDIVGKMTMSSLDGEMAKLRSTRLNCSSNYGPIHSPKQNRNYIIVFFRPEQVSAQGGVLQPLLKKALDAVPAAIDMRKNTKDALNAVIEGSATPNASLCSQALTRHYKVTSNKDIIETAKQLRDFLAQMVSRLLSARAWLREGSTTDTGFAQTPDPRDGHTYILPGYASAGRLMSPLVLIHESFHDLDRGNVDFGGNPVNDQGARYHQNDTAVQLKNAYAMSQFVLHINVGKERFLTDNE